MSMMRCLKNQIPWLVGFLLLAGLAFPTLALAQSSDPPSPLLPASPNAGMIATLYWVVFWMAVAIFIAVEALLIYAALRFRRRSDDEVPVQIHGNNRMEIAWTVGSALVVVPIFALSFQVLFDNAPPTADGVSPVAVASVCFNSDVTPDEAAAFLSVSTLTVNVTGKQWWWQMEYPDYGFSTATDMYVPVGEVVVLQMTAEDVVHAWWVPQLAGKQDVYPGITTYSWFQATEPGVYEGHCTELCGASHAYMPMRVIALEPEEFERWAERQGTPVREPATDLERQGADLLASKGCIGCHAFNGISDSSRVGPNLTHVASRFQIAGIVPYSPTNMRTWLTNPVEMKPGAKMPNLNLTEQELDALVTYLDTLR